MQRDSAVSLWTVGVLLCGAGWAVAQSRGSFGVLSSTVDGGGGTSSSAQGQYIVSGTAGQPDAGRLAGGAYKLTGGFWSAPADVTSPPPTRTVTPIGPTPTPGASPVPAGGGNPLVMAIILCVLSLSLVARGKSALDES